MDCDNEEVQATKRKRTKNDCEYCKGKLILKSCNFGGSAKIQILGNTLDIYGNEKKFNIFKSIYRPRFEINYCPMCGRKLGD